VSAKLKTNVQRITELTNKWYTYVNLDHHKSRDCVWYIETSYAFGEAPKYKAYHNGYIINSWDSPECDTLEDAEQWLINKLEREIEKAIIHLQEIIEAPEEEQWHNPDTAIDILKEIVK
jgi:hypothetical protein